MHYDFQGARLAIIGGSDPCTEIIDLLCDPDLAELDTRILLVADPIAISRGIAHARNMGIPTDSDYAAVCELTGLNLIIKLKNDALLSGILEKINTDQTRIIDLDRFEALSLIGYLKTRKATARVRSRIRETRLTEQETADLFDRFSAEVIRLSESRIAYLEAERQDLLKTEKELHQIIQGSMIPTFIINSDHIITHWNKACEQLTGYPAYEVVGTDRQWVPFRTAKRPTLADVVVDQMPEDVVRRYYGTECRNSCILSEGYEMEEFFPHLGVEGKWIFFTAAPIKSPDGKIIGAIETLKDITENKKSHEEIELQDRELAMLHEKYKKSEEKYRSLFNENPNPIFIIDSPTLEILDANHRVQDYYGYPKSEVLGMSFLQLCNKDDDSIHKSLNALEMGKSTLLTKQRQFRKNGDIFFVNIKAVKTRYSHRDVLLASTTDITESVEKETQLIQAGKLATLGTMAAGMAHEINQPLNVIQICADLMRKMIKKGVTITPEELDGMATDIIDNVARAAGVIKHVRDFARQSERDVKKLVLNDPIRDVFKVLGHQISAHAITLKLELCDPLPEIRAEHNRLEQVFINLVSNAIDAMDEKARRSDTPVEKRLTIRTFVQDRHVVAVVSDTGIGMSKTVRSKIFEPFFTTKETGRGTGLGTSISLGIIKDYNGSIAIESEAGQGASFIVRFPVCE